MKHPRLPEAMILIVEDEQRSAELVCRYLERAGYRSAAARDGRSGLDAARRLKPDLILLDLMLPGISGSEVCRILRRESDVPIIMLTARGGRDDKLQGLSGGADDYIVKPFDPDELLVRIEAVLRRTKSTVRRILECGPMILDEDSGELKVFDEAVELTHAQMAILAVFLRQPGTLLSRGQLISQAFAENYEAYDRAIDTHIRRLRKIINRPGFEPIQTVYGAGYKLICG